MLRATAVLAAPACALLLGACGIVRTAAEAPGKITNAVLPGGEPPPPPPDQMLSDLFRHADALVLGVEEATQSFEREVTSPEAKLQAAKWRLQTLRAATQVPAGPSTVTGLLDMVVVTSCMLWLHQDSWIPEVWGEADRPMEVALQRATEDGWRLLEKYLTEKQVKEAHDVLGRWRAEHARVTPETLVEIPNFLSLAESKEEGGGGGLLGAVGLDPLSGLEPTAQAVERVRLFGQKALFFVQRAPRLIDASVEVRVLEMREAPETKQALLDVSRISASVESFARTAESLPEELEAQRAGLIADLETSRESLQPLLEEARATLDTATRTSDSLNETVRTLDGFLAGFRKEEGAEPVAAAGEEPGKPFDIAEYGDAAERIGVAARELTALVKELESSQEAASRLLDESTARGEALVDRAMLLALAVGIALIVAAASASALVRRWGRGGEPPR